MRPHCQSVPQCYHTFHTVFTATTKTCTRLKHLLRSSCSQEMSRPCSSPLHRLDQALICQWDTHRRTAVASVWRLPQVSTFSSSTPHVLPSRLHQETPVTRSTLSQQTSCRLQAANPLLQLLWSLMMSFGYMQHFAAVTRNGYLVLHRRFPRYEPSFSLIFNPFFFPSFASSKPRRPLSILLTFSMPSLVALLRGSMAFNSQHSKDRKEHRFITRTSSSLARILRAEYPHQRASNSVLVAGIEYRV